MVRSWKSWVVPTLGVTLAASWLTVVPPASAAVLPCNNGGNGRPYRDLNGDGFEDAVVGDPYATVNGQAEAGTVTILFGGGDGSRIGEGGARRTLTQSDLDQTPQAGDHFGWSVALNRTDSGGCYGIIIGSPGEDVSGQVNAGLAHILTLAPVFEADPAADWITNLDQSDLGGTIEADDEFGYAVAALGGSDEYAVRYAFGAPGENGDQGVVNYSDERHPDGVQLRQGSRGLPGTPQAGDRFGEVVAFGEIRTSPDDDDVNLLIGTPGDVVSGHDNAGSMMAFRSEGGSSLVTQDSAGVPGKAEAGDRFGSSITQSEIPPIPNPRTVAIGAPGEDVGSASDAGSVTVLKRSGSTNLPTIALTQDTAGVAGKVEAGDRFGAALAYRDDRTMAIGIPGEDLGTVVDAGSVQIIRIGKSNLGFPSPSITEDSPGTPGVVQANSRFGSTVTGLPSNDSVVANDPPNYGEAVFAISSPFQNGGSVYVISSDPDIAPRSWQPGTGGIGGPGVRFGQAVA